MDIESEIKSLSRNRKMRRALNKKSHKLLSKAHYFYDDSAEYLLNIAECEIIYGSVMKRLPRGSFKPNKLK